MRFSLAAAVLAFASSAFAQEPLANYHALTKPVSNEVIKAGEKFTIEWTLSTLPNVGGPVDLILFSGADHTLLQPVTPKIATGIDASALKYEWAVDASVGGAKAYGLKIALSSDNAIFQWSNPFTIAGAAVNTTSPTSAPTSSSSSSSSVSSLTAQSTTLTTATTPSGNFSTPTGPTRTGPTTTGSSGSGSQTTPTTTARTTISSGAAAAATAFAGSFAVLGGVAMAVLGM